MAQRRRARMLKDVDMERPAAFLSTSSSDDEEANRDLSLEIVERARRRQEEGRKVRKRRFEASARPVSLALDPSSSDEVDAVAERRNGGHGETPRSGGKDATPVVEVSGKKKKKKKRQKKQKEADEDEGVVRGGTETADPGVVKDEEEVIDTADSVITEVNDDISDNIVLRKLLRGPRYFDPGNCHLGSCYNCGDEGHMAATCSAEKRKKPCFVCGLFGHNANKCSQGQDCFICKRRGHHAKDCPDKRKNNSHDTRICIRCGDLGHDISSCKDDYPPDDLKKIQCYVCKSFGHFCCVSFIDTAPRKVSCYNCGDSGHSGVGCAKPCGQSSVAVSPTVCYVCGEEGHFARGCTIKSKFYQRRGELSTPSQPSQKKKDFRGSKSLPLNFGKGYEERSVQSECRRSIRAGKSKIKGGWIVDDPGDLPRRIREVKSSRSPRTPKGHVERSYRSYRPAGNSHNYHI